MEYVSEDKVQANITYVQLFKKLWPYAKRHLGLFISVLVAVGLFTLIARALPLIFARIIDQGILLKDAKLITVLSITYFGLEILKNFLMFGYQFLFQKFGNRVLFYVREDLLKHVQSLPLTYFDKNPVGRIITRLTNDVANLSDLFTDGLISVFVEFLVLVSLVVAMFLISPKLTLIVLISTPFFMGASFWLSEKIRVILRNSKKKMSEMNSFIAESINGIKVVQLYRRAPRAQRRMNELSTEYAAISKKSIIAYAAMMPIMNIFNALTLGLALWYAGGAALREEIPVGLLVAFLIYVQDFIPPLREILEKYQQFQNSLTSAERVFQLFDEKAEKQTEAVLNHEISGQISIRNLNFKYEQHLPLVLKDINLEIQAGTSVAFVGRTGSGKTTTVSLIQKMYSAPPNSIFIDGNPIEKITNFDLRRQIGVIQQDPFIFRGTIFDNIAFGKPDLTEVEAQKILESISYWPLLVSSGRNLRTEVSERGANLSLGERQLLSFARILATDPKVLILDEATANIDSETELIIQRATEKITEGRTSLIIAHRLSTIENCSKIVVFDRGEIVEAGTHSELFKKQGYYFNLHQNVPGPVS